MFLEETPMYLQKTVFLVASLLLLATSLVGCAPEDGQTDSPSVGLANPASVYCQGLGFEEETRENGYGQYGVCIFPDGTECDTWDFLAGRCGVKHSYCVRKGFKLQASKDTSIGTCLFDDGSTCNEYLYYDGKCKPGER